MAAYTHEQARKMRKNSKIKNIINILQILAGLLVVAAYGFIAIKTAFFGVAVACWFGVYVGARCALDGAVKLIKR